MLEFTEEESRDMFKLLSGVLQLGNIEFMTAGGAQITTKQGEHRHIPPTHTHTHITPPPPHTHTHTNTGVRVGYVCGICVCVCVCVCVSSGQ